MHPSSRILFACSLAAACGGGGTDIQVDEQTREATTFAGRAAPAPRIARWTGTQFCTGSADGEPIKSSEEVELGAYEKSRTRVRLVGLDGGPSREHSCLKLELEALVSMSDKSGAFFEGGEAIPCSSSSGRRLTAQVGLGHDTDLRWIEPSDAPTLSFDVELREVDASDGGLAAQLPAFFRCSFDLELR